ncbi:MAG: Hsp20/alpha crystallin family protein [Actinomycetota bacterium]
MLLRFDPFAEFDRMTRRLESGGTFMAADGYRLEEAFVLHLDMPGIDPDSIDLTVEKNTLTVSAERHWEPSEDIHVVMRERPVGTFTRRFFLGEGLDTDAIEAGYDQGILTVRIPVRETAKPRKITVGNADRTLTGSTS